MMDRELEARLIECLSALESQPLDAVLARYPEDAAWLRPLLETALALTRLRPEPSPAARARSKAAFLAAAGETRRTAAVLPARERRFRLPLLEALALVLIVAGTGAILIAASGSALPGSTLYGIKLSTEELRLLLAPDDSALVPQFEQERREEVRTLLESGREADVTFSGTLESIQADLWIVSALPVQVTPDTVIWGEPAPGRWATVEGRTAGNAVQASTIIIEETDAQPTPGIPTPASPAPATQTTPATSRPASTATPTPVVPTLTVPTAAPSSTPEPLASSPPPPEDGGGEDNENGNANSNDNDDDGDGGGNSGSGGGDDDEGDDSGSGNDNNGGGGDD